MRSCVRVIALCSGLYGQAQSGTIVGTITDPGGAIVPEAKVKLTNEGTQLSRVATTNSNGQYVASSVPTGVDCRRHLTVDVQLTVGSVQESIEVKETVPLLQSQTAAVSSLVSNQQIVEMPLNGRTFTQLLRLSVGAYTGSGNNLFDSPYAMRGDNNISVNGSSAQNNSYLIDGMFNRNPPLRAMEAQFPLGDV